MKNKKRTQNRRQASTGSCKKQMSFLPEADFNPKLPGKKTLAARALDLLMQGRKISHPGFQRETGSWRLAAYIDVLNKLEWPISSSNMMYDTPKHCVPISLYFLDKETIKKFKRLSGGAR